MPAARSRLSDYPFVIVRVGCQFCTRQGSYRLARLAAKYGPEIGLDALLDALATDCRWHRNPGERGPGKYDAKCGAYSRISACPSRLISHPPCGSLGWCAAA